MSIIGSSEIILMTKALKSVLDTSMDLVVTVTSLAHKKRNKNNRFSFTRIPRNAFN